MSHRYRAVIWKEFETEIGVKRVVAKMIVDIFEAPTRELAEWLSEVRLKSDASFTRTIEEIKSDR